MPTVSVWLPAVLVRAYLKQAIEGRDDSFLSETRLPMK